jgi:hypothetical protein
MLTETNIVHFPAHRITGGDIAALHHFCQHSPRGWDYEVLSGEFASIHLANDAGSEMNIIADTKRQRGWVGVDSRGAVFATGETIAEVIGALGFKRERQKEVG